MAINRQTIFNIIFLLNSIINVNSKPAYIETVGAQCDYEELGTNTRNVPIILSDKSQRTAFAGKPIYVAPDFNDILDQQTYNVYHEEVHGTILMPRVKFSLNNGDDCIKEKDDYYDYGNAMNGLNTRYLEMRPRTLRKPSYNPYRYARYPMSRVDPNAPVKVDFSGSYNPTIEEMVPYMKRRHTPDTYIVMVDDPVLVVDSVPNCSNETGNSTTTTTTAASAAETTPTTTAAPAARKKRQVDKVLQAVGGGGGGSGGGGSGGKRGSGGNSDSEGGLGGLTGKRKKRQVDKVLQAVGGGGGGSGGGGSGGGGSGGGGSGGKRSSGGDSDSEGGLGGLTGKRKKRSPKGGLSHPKNIRMKRSPQLDLDFILMQAQNDTEAPHHSASSTTTGKPKSGALKLVGK